MNKWIVPAASALLLVAVTLGLDQWTKYAVASQMVPGQSLEVIKNFFYITYVQNTGAGFSMFAGAGIGFFSVITLAAMAFIVWYFFKTRDLRIQLSLALIFSGALGNYIDRLRFGYVIDFFSVNLFGWWFPIFNVADICITVGFVCLIATYLYDDLKGAGTNGTESV